MTKTDGGFISIHGDVTLRLSSTGVFRENRCAPIVNFQFSTVVTLKLRSRSPNCNQYFTISQLYIRGNLVRITPLVYYYCAGKKVSRRRQCQRDPPQNQYTTPTPPPQLVALGTKWSNLVNFLTHLKFDQCPFYQRVIEKSDINWTSHANDKVKQRLFSKQGSVTL